MGTGGNNVPVVAQEPIIIDRAAYNQGENARYEPVIEESHTMPSLVARGPHAVGQEEVQAISYDGYNQVVEEEIHRPWRIGKDSSDFIADFREPTLIVRRLTPLECERLMGWPDNHTAESTNGSVSDTQRYKMCGNGVASPVATWIAKHILANGT
jgi:DNA (cytosine-5)-methyltransferase 1